MAAAPAPAIPASFARPALARVLPFGLFIALLAAQPLLEGWLDTRWVVVARALVVAALLAFFWKRYVELAGAPRAPGQWLLAIAVGAGVFLVWITFDSGWAVMGGGDGGGGFVPLRADGSMDWSLALLRLAGLVLVVPLMEELFWRSLVMRWIDRRDFLSVDPRRASLAAFGISSALFAVEHSMWFAGLLAGLAYGWLYMRSRNLWIPIVSHATTNGILGIWILATGNWRFW